VTERAKCRHFLPTLPVNNCGELPPYVARVVVGIARRRSRLWLLPVVLVLVACTFLGTALAPSSSGKNRHFSVVALAGRATPNPLAGRLSKVYGTDIPASRYGTEVADLEDEGTNVQGEQVSDLSPIPAKDFDGPEREYRAYAVRWISKALVDASALGSALAVGDPAAAQRSWESTWSDYMHLGAVYGLFGELNQRIDGNPGDVPGGVTDPNFTGLHRLEMGLWTGEPLRSLVVYDDKLERDLAQLRSLVPTMKITPLEYATRSHEILEDAQRDLLSNMDVPWSRQGVLGTAAGVAATEELFHTLEPLLGGRENTEGEVRTELLMLGELLRTIRRKHHGGYPSLPQLSIYEREQLDGYVAGALSALDQMPGVLETEIHRAPPKLVESR
jgi:iron uptake system EfeUOB component EfeO/EfeM